ncbi:hypothetical protein WJ60_30155 [Burkholderia ubonensis]|nr:hypothetical protein WJ60_30155 [Burkholderia ubonensis]
MVVRSNRGAAVRALRYNRTSADDALDERIERTVVGPLGFVTSRVDARLFTSGGTPNFAYGPSLAGQVLRTAGVDAGTTVSLADVDGRPAWARDARGTVSAWTYDPLGRPLTATDTPAGGAPAVHDVWVYGDAAPDATAHNRRGRCVRRYDPAGRLAWPGFALTGQPLAETRTLLANPDAEADWAGDDEAAWAAALEPVAYPTAWTYDATGAWRTQTDAMGNLQTRRFDVAGRLAASALTPVGGAARPVLAALTYSAAGQVLTETAGNGVLSAYAYEPETQRLIRLTVTRPAQAGRPAVLQDLQYTYDPVGNVTGVTDAAQAPTYWRNQRVEAARTYAYDALDQLIRATGRETVNRGRQGTALPPALPLPGDDTVYTGYTRRYAYDRAGNLTQIAHQGATAYTQDLVVSATSNHALAQNAQQSLTPADVDAGRWFDAAGNPQQLLPDRAQPLAWNGRNRLAGVTRVQRDTQPDRETYQYGADGMRVRKHATTQTSGTTRTSESIYLPGLTLRLTRSDDGQTVTVVEALHELRLDAGRTGARALHWETGLPKALANDALRYSYGELIGSIGLELDEHAALISREEYYPYGGTAVWAARSAVEAETKFIRYSGQERDATGLYDYGWRSYQPWLGRWLNPDPAGIVDGLNLFRMVRNNPLRYVDSNGNIAIPVDIFLADIMNPFNPSIGTGWFEELTWNATTKEFNTSSHPYGRGMEEYSDQQSDWNRKYAKNAIAIFRDQDNKARLFVNMYQQHMGIQPGMGLPEFAGIIESDEHWEYESRMHGEELFSGKYHITNHSGHYKPSRSINIQGLINEIIPEGDRHLFSFSSISESHFDESVRMENLNSPEYYADLTNKIKGTSDRNKALLAYLKENNLWNATKERHSDLPDVQTLMNIENPPATASTSAPIHPSLPVPHRSHRVAPESNPGHPGSSIRPERRKGSVFKCLFPILRPR